jgi:hypothetical protein
LAKGCLAEWDAGRESLRSGRLRQHFEECSRADLVRIAKEAEAANDDDIALQTFLEHLPGLSAPVRPLADPLPRRLNVEEVFRNEVRVLPLKLLNRGTGYLHGTISVVEGDRWLWLGEGVSPAHICRIGTRAEQTLSVQVDPTLLPAVGSYLGKLRLETNGGNLEIPVQANLINRAGRFMGHAVGSEKDLAKLLRDRPRDAVNWLKAGAVREWYADNGLPYPVKGESAPDLAGIQQFFESAGFNRAPDIRLDQEEVAAHCLFPEVITRSVELTTRDKKWLYAFVESDSLWLKPHAPVAVGPQRAEIIFDVDSGLLEAGRAHEGALRITANSGQLFRISVTVDVRRPNEPFTRWLLRPFLSG